MKYPARTGAGHPRILVCPDSFKGSLSAVEASGIMSSAILRVFPQALVSRLPLADGGEGTIGALSRAGGRIVRAMARGPLGRPVKTSILLLPGRTAVVEMAQSAGLLLVPEWRRDPMRASTFGTGQNILEAIRRGARHIIVFTGGSATTDGGAGMAQALGARLLDGQGRDIPPGGTGLLQLRRIDASLPGKRFRGITVSGATDVRNPLLGRRGSALNFAPQKGASPAQVKTLERGLANLARVIHRDIGRDISRIPGAGSAGGTGAGLAAFCGAQLVPGAPLVFDILDLDRHLKTADLVMTGEGSLDHQTAMGKLVAQLARRARRFHVPVIAIAGRVVLSPEEAARMGLARTYSLSDLAGEEMAMKFVKDLLAVNAGWAAHEFLKR